MTFLYNKFTTFGLLCFSIFFILSGSFPFFPYIYIYIYIYIYMFQGIHPQVLLTTSSVMFFPGSLGVSVLSTWYTFTRMTQPVLISHQLVVKNLPVAKSHPKYPWGLYKVVPVEHPIKFVSKQSLSHNIYIQ